MDPELPPAVSELLAKDPDRYSKLTHEQAEFLLRGSSGDDFVSEADAAAMWAVHRELLMASYWGSGRRPIAWWQLEHPEVRWRGHDRQRSTLYEANLLEPEERELLTNEWRREFEHAEGLAPDARQKHHAWADIPRSLIREWRRERRRRPAA